ncbi:hypothetical protein FJU31_12405 [Stenotrophomonas cyclobalanopsidis]|uniref:Uncharacterized protein n=1 Tax=Stenotrophomonas cyclobalanopsidis TaxID=2771362 RepID=A0ABQ6SZ84_9GAMM|nr:hypothetical protein [Stenotrophomonas cyclobalanopsidis]KAA8996765.1 hypothetical protein FJU31_12405 [Stenotrophomonas cyclobalanopsidis]
MNQTKRFNREPLKLPMTRSSEVVRARRQLQYHGWPRLQMALMSLWIRWRWYTVADWRPVPPHAGHGRFGEAQRLAPKPVSLMEVAQAL